MKKLLKSALVVLVIYLLLSNPKTVQAEYRVGVDYHATTSTLIGTIDNPSSAFIAQYNKPEVRATVQSQLQFMADSGAKIINTRLWMTDPPSARFPNNPERLGFPFSEQELQNIRQYVQDISVIRAPDGKYLDLYLTILWNGCADFTEGYDKYCHYTWDQFTTIAKKSISDFFTAIGDITRPDGLKAVRIAYEDGEVMMYAKKNQDKMLLDIWPYFIDKANQYGIKPSIYFITQSLEQEVLDDSFTDGEYHALNGHKSLYWLYRSTDFMKKNNIPIPERLDISFYPTPDKTNFATVIKRVFDDIQALYPGTPVGIAETNYLQDQAKRREFGQAFAQEYQKRGMPQELVFWTTPDSGGTGINAGFPFDFSAYYLPVIKGDIDKNNKVDIFDYDLLVQNFGKTDCNNVADIDGNCKVDIFDYNILVGNFRKIQ